MNILRLLALSLLVTPGIVLAQTPTPNPSAAAVTRPTGQVIERHPQAGCLGAVRRELGDYAGAVDQGLKTGRLDPNKRPDLERILGELTTLEAAARADKNLTGDACKGLYKRIVAENAGIQTTMRARPYGAATAPTVGVGGK